jgi:anti-sigma regulatory factor (Ser/Thr protein kinase)
VNDVRRSASGSIRKQVVQRSATFAGNSSSIREARDFVTSILESCGWLPGQIEDVRLIVSELATNAVLHAKSPFEVQIRLDEDLRVRVRDARPERTPRLRPVHDDVPGGRGLHIVARLADEWGVVQGDSDKSTWFVVRPATGDRAGARSRTHG